MRVARAVGVTLQSRRDLPLVAVPPRGASADRSGLRQLADLQSGGDSSAGGLRTLPCRAWHPKLYQIYGNASKLVGYAIQPDGALNEVTSVSIPYNSPQGLAGF